MDLLIPLLVFASCVLGGGLLAATFLPTTTDPLERLALGLAAHLLALFLLGFGVHALAAPRAIGWTWPVLLAIALLARRAPLRALLAEPDIRTALGRWALFATWGLGLLLCVKIYGGGYWAADWLEHYERACFWRLGGEPGTRFLYDLYSLGARPPLANIVGGVLLELSGGGFPRHLVLNTLLGTLLIFPFTLLTRSWAPERAAAASAAALGVLLLSPMVAQNLSFGWTRHFTAFWVLLGAHHLLRGFAAQENLRDRTLGFAALAAAFLSHYSAGPAIFVGVAAFLWFRRNARPRVALFAETARHAAVCGALLALWFGWATIHIGPAKTFASNSTATSAIGQTPAQNIAVFFLNVRDTLVPHPFRQPALDPVCRQPSPAGRTRDYFFNLYQINLPLMLGLAGLGPLLLLAVRPSPYRHTWMLAVGAYVLIGIGVHTARDELGLGHICLQPLVLLGLARIAALLATEPRFGVARLLWLGGATVDLTLGIVLPFALQTHRFGGINDFGGMVLINAEALRQNGLVMPRLSVGPPDVLLALVLAAVLAVVLLCLLRVPRPASMHQAKPCIITVDRPC